MLVFNPMNKILSCLLVLFLGMGQLVAQMTPAKRVLLAVESKVVLNVPVQKVWKYISEPANYKKFAGVKEFSCEGRVLDAKIRLETKDGNKREQYISVLDEAHYRICYFVTYSDYDGDRQWVYSFEVLPDGDQTCEFIMAVYHGLEPVSENFRIGITGEFNEIITRLTKKFK